MNSLVIKKAKHNYKMICSKHVIWEQLEDEQKKVATKVSKK
jgi:hypothetical protein